MTREPLRATISLRGVVFGPDGDVLLVRRETDGGWELPGGRLDAEETATAGVRREITEETGLDPTVGRPVHATAWRNANDDGRFAVYYRCRVARRSVSLSAEHVAHGWVPPAAARERLSDPQGTAVERAVDRHESPPR